MHNPDISVVIPVYNKENYLEACLTSVLDQSFSNIEILCIDDFSSDGSRDILTDFSRKDRRLRVYRNLDNLGPGPSRNRGIDAARGKYIQFVDADDLLPVDAIKSLHELAIDTGSAIVRGSCTAFPENQQWFEEHCPSFTAPNRKNFSFIDEPRIWIPWFHTTYLFLRCFLIEYGIRYPSLREGEDPVFLAAALTAANHISAISNVCYIYRTDRPYRRSSIPYKIDHLRHVALIKQIYTERAADAWHNASSSFYLSIVKEYIHMFKIDNSDFDMVTEILRQIWSSDELAAAGIRMADGGFLVD